MLLFFIETISEKCITFAKEKGRLPTERVSLFYEIEL